MIMLQIKLQDNLFDVEIEGSTYTVNVDKIENHQAIDYMLNNYKGNRIVTEDFIKDCKQCIDTILGNGSYDKIFKVDDIKPFYVIIAIAEEIQSRFKEATTTEKQREREKQAKDELMNIMSISKELKNINEQMDYVQNRYGIKKYVNSKQKRPSRNNRNKRY